MRKTIIIAISILFSGVIFAQESNLQIISSAGDQFAEADMNISYTIGEPVVSTLQNDNYTLTQGYHQSGSTVTRIDFSESRELDLKLFPNPTTRFLNINGEVTGLTCIVYDMSGKLIHQEEVSGSNLVLDLSYYADGTYLLNLLDASGKPVEKFKIVKNNR